MTSAKDQIENMLKDRGSFQKGKFWLCIFHTETNPSLQVYQNEKGKWVYYCFGCQSKGDVYDMKDFVYNNPKGTSYKNHNSANSNPKSQKAPDCAQKTYTLKEIEENGGITYYYYDYEGRGFNFIVKRWDSGGGGKQFGQYSQDNNGQWIGRTISPLRLYIGSPSHAQRLREAQEIVVTEGENKVQALHRVGIVATTKPGGAQAPELADWSPLYGKTVVLWPDNDSYDEKMGCCVGIRYMEQVRDLLMPHCKVRMIDPTRYQLPDKGDAVDWCMAINWDKSMAGLPIEEAVSCGDSRLIKKQMMDIALGNRVSIKWPWPQLGYLSQALIPQTTTLICGEGGDGKSLFMSQAMIEMLKDGVKFAVYDLEEDREHRVGRALAQIEGNSDILQYDWLLGKTKEVNEICDKHADFMDKLGQHIWSAPDRAIKRDVVLNWIESRAKDKCRVIIIDPITALGRSDKQIYEADEDFVSATKVLTRKYNMSVVYVTHPTKGRKNPVSIDGLQGGSAYGRFCQTIIWVEWVKCNTLDPKQKKITCLENYGGRKDFFINRKVHLIKTRNGKGRSILGFWFNPATLKFEELGIIM